MENVYEILIYLLIPIYIDQMKKNLLERKHGLCFKNMHQ